MNSWYSTRNHPWEMDDKNATIRKIVCSCLASSWNRRIQWWSAPSLTAIQFPRVVRKGAQIDCLVNHPAPFALHRSKLTLENCYCPSSPTHHSLRHCNTCWYDEYFRGLHNDCCMAGSDWDHSGLEASLMDSNQKVSLVPSPKEAMTARHTHSDEFQVVPWSFWYWCQLQIRISICHYRYSWVDVVDVVRPRDSHHFFACSSGGQIYPFHSQCG